MILDIRNKLIDRSSRIIDERGLTRS